jgi:hypothetical protein
VKRRKEKMAAHRVRTKTKGGECKNAKGKDISIVCIAITQVHSAHVYM